MILFLVAILLTSLWNNGSFLLTKNDNFITDQKCVGFVSINFLVFMVFRRFSFPFSTLFFIVFQLLRLKFT